MGEGRLLCVWGQGSLSSTPMKEQPRAAGHPVSKAGFELDLNTVEVKEKIERIL